jgi:hypothetical protein
VSASRADATWPARFAATRAIAASLWGHGFFHQFVRRHAPQSVTGDGGQVLIGCGSAASRRSRPISCLAGGLVAALEQTEHYYRERCFVARRSLALEVSTPRCSRPSRHRHARSDSSRTANRATVVPVRTEAHPHRSAGNRRDWRRSSSIEKWTPRIRQRRRKNRRTEAQRKDE